MQLNRQHYDVNRRQVLGQLACLAVAFLGSAGLVYVAGEVMHWLRDPALDAATTEMQDIIDLMQRPPAFILTGPGDSHGVAEVRLSCKVTEMQWLDPLGEASPPRLTDVHVREMHQVDDDAYLMTVALQYG